MANLHAGHDAAAGVSGLFRARYPEMVRLADLLGADDPEDISSIPADGPPAVRNFGGDVVNHARQAYDAAGRVVWQKNFPG